MIIEVTECNYRGILIDHVDNRGWKFSIDEKVYLFPHLSAAQAAIDELYRELKPILKKYKAIKYKE